MFYAFLFFYAIIASSFSKTVLLNHIIIENSVKKHKSLREKKNVLISSARLYVHKNVKINAYICIMYILVWPHNGVKSFLEEYSNFSASVLC